MAVFDYKAINIEGERLDGTIEAPDDRNALNALKSRELYVIELVEKKEEAKELKLFKGVGAKTLAIFCRQLSIMLNAGVNLLKALDVLREQEENKTMSKALHSLYERVEKGTPVSFAMKEHKDIFPDILVNMTEAGELSGSLETSFESMAVYFEKEDSLKKKLTNTLIYPVVVLVVTLVVLSILLVFVVPTFTDIFMELDVELPAITNFLIALSEFLKTKWYIIAAVLFAVAWMVRRYAGTENGKKALDQAKLKNPITKNTMLNALTSRFAGTLATLLAAGIPLIEALETTGQVLGNALVMEKFEDVIKGVRRGEVLSGLVAGMGIFPSLLSVMIRTGEESGSIDTVLQQVADFYEKELDNSITRLTAALEPAIILFLGLIVGGVLAAIIVPMFQLYGSIK